MALLPQDFLLLNAAVFALGMKHGLDADHLAAVDGLTRFNSRDRPRLARSCGALFSLGHGAVVMGVGVAVSLLAGQWRAPGWLGPFGALVSIVILAALGLANLRTVWRSDSRQMVSLVGFKGRFLGRLTRAASPGLIALVGVLFALSFDTLSQAALFAMTSAQFGGWRHALVTGLCFMLGMLLIDGINGLWIAQLLRRADATALIVARAMGLLVGGLSLLVAGFGAAKLVLPRLDAWSDHAGPWLGMTVVVIVAAVSLVLLWLLRSRPPALAAE